MRSLTNTNFSCKRGGEGGVGKCSRHRRVTTLTFTIKAQAVPNGGLSPTKVPKVPQEFLLLQHAKCRLQLNRRPEMGVSPSESTDLSTERQQRQVQREQSGEGQGFGTDRRERFAGTGGADGPGFPAGRIKSPPPDGPTR